MIKYAVNEEYPFETLKNNDINADFAYFDLCDLGCIFHIFYADPKEIEVDNIQNGRIRMAISIVENFIFVHFKFGCLPWIDAPYNFYLSKDLTALEDMEPDKGLATNIILTDNNSKRIKVIRVVSLGNNFSNKFQEVILNHSLNMPFKQNENQTKVAEIFRKYSSEELLKFAVFNDYIA